MNNKLSLTFILNSLLLAIWISASALNARAEWELIAGNEDMGNIYTLHSDGHRLFAGSENGVYLSDDTATPGASPYQDASAGQLQSVRIACIDLCANMAWESLKE